MYCLQNCKLVQPLQQLTLFKVFFFFLDVSLLKISLAVTHITSLKSEAGEEVRCFEKSKKRKRKTATNGCHLPPEMIIMFIFTRKNRGKVP